MTVKLVQTKRDTLVHKFLFLVICYFATPKFTSYARRMYLHYREVEHKFRKKKKITNKVREKKHWHMFGYKCIFLDIWIKKLLDYSLKIIIIITYYIFKWIRAKKTNVTVCVFPNLKCKTM